MKPIASISYVVTGVAAIVASGAGVARAQIAPDLDQLQRQNFQQRQQELQRIAPPGASVQLRGGQPGIPTGGTCERITRIEVNGADHLDPAALHTALAPFVNKCLGLSDINDVINAINALYIAHGYVTSRAFLPEQNLSGGTLKIIVVEGLLEKFQFAGKAADEHQEAAFPGLAGHVLNLRDLEQGLEQMNRLSSWNATMHVAPGDTPGSSIVIIEAPPAPWASGRLYADNDGTEETGRWTGHVSADFDDPLGLLDDWGGEYDHNIFPVPGTRASSYASANMSVPHGYWTFYASFDYSNYHYPVPGLNAVFDLDGYSQRSTLGLDRVLARDQVSKTSLEFGYQLERTGAALDHVSLATGSDNLASVSARLSYTRQIWGGAWYTTLGLQWGLPSEGTSDTLAVTAPYVPHAVYLKPSLDINAFQPFKLGHQSVEWQPSLHAEYADQTEYGSDRLQIGGTYTVRGFLNSTFAGDYGVYVHNDIVWTLPPVHLPHGVAAQTKPYLGLDAGWAAADAVQAGTAPAFVRAVLVGAAIGVRNTTGPFYIDAAATHALTNGPLPPEGWIFTVQAGVTF